ncbi:glycoside hydrolase family 28 protein [Mucilaginibacter sp. SJ]|uniref:glycoside hydrolase family 28 protein n=1 Tax=Mucilaginibacter sp. SJ TaxID=3029053 RepID=UPI0023A9D07A|nr:glycoside hydrolase family 28 protein [Mucilaginibacter sp. SJ]WEA02367.1 glycoside hydrolase family 28 protein [Mucilaginibacter sp. SJ]
MHFKKLNLLAILLFSLGLEANGQKSKTVYSWQHLPGAELPSFKTDTFNIEKFGAKPNGFTLNTQSINDAVSACNKNGGGVVLIPPGFWLTGPIVMQSNVNLHLSQAAVLQFTSDKGRFPLVEGNFEGHKSIRNQSPISGKDLQNIAITGEGIVDGHGEVWRAMGKDNITDRDWKALIASGGELSDDGRTWYPSASYAKGARTRNAGYMQTGKKPEDYQEIKDFFRPNLVVFSNCKKVLLQGTTFQNSAAWCLHTLQCEDLTFDGVHIRNPSNAQNGDGMDIESCSNVRVVNCTIDAGDDGICIKSGKDEEGRKVGKPCQNILIQNNVVYRAHGGFVIGSEMSGGAHDIFVSDCSFFGTDNGLRFKTVRGRGGVVENIYIRNISMRDIVRDAILFDMYYFTKAPSLAQTGGEEEKPPVNDGTPQFRNFYINDVVCDGANRAMLIRGLPEMSIKDIHLKNISIKADQGAEIIDASDVSLTNVMLQCKSTKPLVHIENSNKIRIDTLASAAKPDLLLSINGKYMGQVNLLHTDTSSVGQVAEFKYGADKSALITTK